MVFGNTLSQWFESNRWRADGVRVENIPRIHYCGHPRRDSKISDWSTSLGILWEIQKILKYIVKLSSSKEGSSSCQCTKTLHWKSRKMSYEFCYSCELCSRILARTLVIFGSWIREEMVRNLFWWTRWRLGQDCWTNDAQLYRKRSPYLSCHQRLGKRRIKKQRKGIEVYALQR